MHRILRTGLLAALVAGTATQALAKSAVHIERQCERYGNFCGVDDTAPKTKKVYKAKKASTKSYKSKAKKKSKTLFVYQSHDGTKPFIERQCSRYGHFC